MWKIVSSYFRWFTLVNDSYKSAGVVVARGGGVAEGLQQRAGGRERARRAPLARDPRAPRAALARHHRALQAHTRRLRLARAALTCNTSRCKNF